MTKKKKRTVMVRAMMLGLLMPYLFAEQWQLCAFAHQHIRLLMAEVSVEDGRQDAVHGVVEGIY